MEAGGTFLAAETNNLMRIDFKIPFDLRTGWKVNVIMIGEGSSARFGRVARGRWELTMRATVGSTQPPWETAVNEGFDENAGGRSKRKTFDSARTNTHTHSGHFCTLCREN